MIRLTLLFLATTYVSAQTLVNEEEKYMCTGTTSTSYNYCSNRLGQVSGTFEEVMRACRADKKCVAIDYSSSLKYGHKCSTFTTASSSSSNWRFCKLLDRHRSPGLIGKCVNIGWTSGDAMTYSMGNSLYAYRGNAEYGTMEECAALARWHLKDGVTEERKYVGYAYELGRSPPCYLLTKENYDNSIKAQTSNNNGKRWVCKTEGVPWHDASEGCWESRHWKSHSNLKSQKTRCAEVTIESNGVRCIRPQIMYGTTWGAIPGNRSGNDYNKWCQFMGYTDGKAVETKFYYTTDQKCPSENGAGRVYWSTSDDDAGKYKWIDWSEGSWKNSQLDYACSGSDMLYSITCSGHCKNSAPSLHPTAYPRCGDGRTLCEINEAYYTAERNVELIRSTIGQCDSAGEVVFLKHHGEDWVFVTDTPKKAYRDMYKFLLHSHESLNDSHAIIIHYQHKTRDGRMRQMRITDDMDLYSAIRMQRTGMGHEFTELQVSLRLGTDDPTSTPTTRTPTRAPSDSPTFGFSITLTDDSMKWLGTVLEDNKKVELGTLLYRMSAHGKTAKDFHDRVDNKGKHVCSYKRDMKNDAIKPHHPGRDQIYGHYTDMSWSSPSSAGYRTCSGCALWIYDDRRYQKKWLRVKQNASNSVYLHKSYGPCFGGNHDFCVSSPSNAQGYSSIGHTYYAPEGSNSYYLGGVSTFYLIDWECWTVISKSS